MEIPSPDSIENVADWVELYTIGLSSNCSKTQLASYVEGSKGGEVDESYINSVWNELKRRQRQYKIPPFEVGSNTIEPKIDWKDVPEYLVCLFFSVYGGSEGLSTSTKLFERITTNTIKSYCGFEVKTFGWPVDENDPKDIETRARRLADVMNERFIEPPNPEKKDDTLDVIGWKPFFDKRNSQLIVFVQCAAGRNWESKTRSLRIEAWKQYIHWGCPPVSSFAVPCVISERKWADISRDSILIFDRIRIYNLISNRKSNKIFRDELRLWCEEQIIRFCN